MATALLMSLHLMGLPIGVTAITLLLLNPRHIQFPTLIPRVPIHCTIQIMIQYNPAAAIIPRLHITPHSIHLSGVQPVSLPFGRIYPSRLNNHCLTAKPVPTSTATLLCIVQQRTGLPNVNNAPNVWDINTHPQCRSGYYHMGCTAPEPAQNCGLVNLPAVICLTFKQLGQLPHYRDGGRYIITLLGWARWIRSYINAITSGASTHRYAA